MQVILLKWYMNYLKRSYHSGIYTEEIVHLIEQNCSLQTKDIKKMPKSNSSRHLFIYSTIYLYLGQIHFISFCCFIIR